MDDATLNTTIVIYGLTAAKTHRVLMGRVTVIIKQTVMEHLSVAMTIVRMNHLEWTVVHKHAKVTMIA